MRYVWGMANEIHPTALIYPGVQLGDNVKIGPYCIIGAPPESREFDGHAGCGVIIGDNVWIHGHNTIDAGTVKPTIIGEGCYLMKQVHLGHDVVLHANVTIAPGAVICGHAVIGEGCNIGVNATVRNRVKVPDNVRIGMSAVICAKTEMHPHQVYAGNPAKWLKAWIRPHRAESFHCIALQEEQPRCQNQCDACKKQA